MNMKKIIVYLFLVIFAAIPLSAEEVIILDVKTAEKDKIEGGLVALKNGTQYFLMKTSYFKEFKPGQFTLVSGKYKCVDTGENFSVWIKNYKKVKGKEEYVVNLTVKLTEPTLDTEKDALIEKKIRYSFPIIKNEENFKENHALTNNVKPKLKNWNDEIAMEAQIGGKEVATLINTMIDELTAGGLVSQQIRIASSDTGKGSDEKPEQKRVSAQRFWFIASSIGDINATFVYDSIERQLVASYDNQNTSKRIIGPDEMKKYGYSLQGNFTENTKVSQNSRYGTSTMEFFKNGLFVFTSTFTDGSRARDSGTWRITDKRSSYDM
jgi:hypothetical protein